MSIYYHQHHYTQHQTQNTKYKIQAFSTDNSSGNNNNNNNGNNNDPANNSKSNPTNNNRANLDETRIYNEARNQKSLVKASGKNKSLVPYIGSVLVVPVQKPLFPGFSSMLYLKDENLKSHFINQYRKRLQAQFNKDGKIDNAKDIINSTEWIGLFLHNPKTSPITAEEELKNAENKQEQSQSQQLTTDDAQNEQQGPKKTFEERLNDAVEEVEQNMDETINTTKEAEIEETKIVWHPALDEVNSDMHHFVESIPKEMNDVFEYGVLAKIDYNDEMTNVAEFVKLQNRAREENKARMTGDEATTDSSSSTSTEKSGEDTQSMNIQINESTNPTQRPQKKKNRKQVQFPVTKMEDPLVLKVISARRIKLDSISEHQPLMTANIQHLQPEIHIKKSDIIDHEGKETENNKNVESIEIINENKHIVNESESEIKTRSAFNVASDLLRRLYADDPDNRREMLQLWSARHHIDIGFFCDFAASITNSTPRELQKLLQCVDYGERLQLLCRLLKREETMMKKRDEIMNHVDALMKKEDESYYLKMILHTTQRRLMLNHRERNILAYGAGNNTGHGANNKYQGGQAGGPQNGYVEGGAGDGGGIGASEAGPEEKRDRYQRLAHKFKERVEGKTMCPEARDVFEEGIEKLLNAKNKESLDVETTKQYLDWISSLPWNHYSIDNDNIKKAREILDNDHYGMKLVKERILEVIACNILRGDLNLNEKYATKDIEEDDGDNNEENKDDDNKEKIMDNKGKEEINDSKILCLVGPPGVGKTSIGSSIARSLNRKFFKFSLGGSDDSHLLKGFLRTYAGAQPGKIIYGLKQCGTANPMILIDEIDKMGARHSDPSHALLEILDPSQNQSFSDNYLDFPVDLSKILFICTANDESKINPVLRDRLHIVRLNGYDEHEKLQIAKNYLIPNALKKCGLKKENINLSDNVITELIKWYCRESGVRSLAQHIERICYKSSLELAEAGITYKDINHIDDDIKSENDGDEIGDKKVDNANEIVEENNNENNGNKGKRILDTLSSFVKHIATGKEGDNNNNNVETLVLDEDGVVDENNNNNNNTNDKSVHSQEIPFVDINIDNLKQYVGLRKYQNDRTYEDIKSTPPGVVTGLAYTTNGGCITYVETIKYRKNMSKVTGGNNGDNNNNNNNNVGVNGGGNIKSTGQLGKVMGESVEIAHVLSRALLSNKIDCNNTFFDDYNIHLHCPEGGIQKDGPSAGITMVTAMLSLALNQSISPNIAMTGEVTLTGKILKIGGLKEKLLAAKRAKINTLLLPYDNYDDFYDDEYGVPKYLREEFKDVHFVKTYDEVLHILFDKHLPYYNDTTTANNNDNNNNNNNYVEPIDMNQSPEMPKPL